MGGVGVARLDGAGERPHGRRVAVAQLARALALAPRGRAQVGGVALELALLGGVLGALALELRAQRGDLGEGVDRERLRVARHASLAVRAVVPGQERPPFLRNL